MTALFAVGLSMAVTAFCILVWWFTTQSLVAETVVLAKLQTVYKGSTLLDKDGGIPEKRSKDSDWKCKMLSPPAARSITYNCMSSDEVLDAAGVAIAVDGSCTAVTDRFDTQTNLATDYFGYSLFEEKAATDALADGTFVSTNPSSGLQPLVTGLKLTHSYQLYETYQECLDEFECVAPLTTKQANEMIIHKVAADGTGDADVRGCLITGLGPSVTEMGSSIYLDLVGENLTIEAKDATSGAFGAFQNGRVRRDEDFFTDVVYCLETYCPTQMGACNEDVTGECGEYLDASAKAQADGSVEAPPGNQFVNDVLSCYTTECSYLEYGGYDDYYTERGGYYYNGVVYYGDSPDSSSGTTTGNEEKSGTLQAAKEKCLEKWNRHYCQLDSDNARASSLGQETFKEQFCAPFKYNHIETVEGGKRRKFPGTPPFACTRLKPRAALEAISLSFSFAEFFYMIVLFGMCRLLWQAYLGTDAGKRAQKEAVELESRLAREAKARAAGEAAPEEDVITLTRKEYDMFLKLSSKMKPARTAAEASQAYITVGGDHGAEDAHADFGAAGANLA